MLNAQLKASLTKSLSQGKVPRYMRVVEDVKYNPIGGGTRNISFHHFIEMHPGKATKLLKPGINQLQVYVALDLGKVSSLFLFLLICFGGALAAQ